MTSPVTSQLSHADTFDLPVRHATAPPGRSWAVAGSLAGLAGAVGIYASLQIDAVYNPDYAGDADRITDRLGDFVAEILVLHTGMVVAAVLLLVFAAGLRRRLAGRLPADSLLPGVAAGGLLLTSAVALLGSGFSTEIVFGLTADDGELDPEFAAVVAHWIGTIPWLWGGIGLTALALASAALRQGAFARWVGWTSLVLGALTTLFLVSPVQYMAGMTGPIWLVVVSAALLRSVRRS